MTEEDPKEIEEVPSTPDRGIPLNVKEKRGCMTSPINKANLRTNMLHLEREWSAMMKIAEETKQKLKGQEMLMSRIWCYHFLSQKSNEMRFIKCTNLDLCIKNTIKNFN